MADLYTAERVIQDIDQLRRDLSGYHGQLVAYNDLRRHSENQRERIASLEALHATDTAKVASLCVENQKLRSWIKRLWHAARLMDANSHIEGMRLDDAFRAEFEVAMAALGVDLDA